MSTVKDFEKAPVGATATDPYGVRAMKMLHDGELRWITIGWSRSDDESMARWGYTLDAPAPTTACEALALAWEVAHEVKEGQVIPKGTRFLQDSDSGLREYTAQVDFKIRPDFAPVRTLEPLPEPDPEWLDAPAVIAHVDAPNIQPTSVFTPTGTHPDRWGRFDSEWTFHWNELRNVIPLYPRGQDV